MQCHLGVYLDLVRGHGLSCDWGCYAHRRQSERQLVLLDALGDPLSI